ncbi:MAG: hypothetical protein NVSMB29_14130 [Candidatus Dormibacteria bacterium]
MAGNAQGVPERPATGAGPLLHTQAGVPGGLGVAVVFDWALGTQLGTQALVAATQHQGPRGIAGRLLAAVLLVCLGEALRRGVRAAWLLQLGLLALVTVGGLRALPGLLHGQIGRASVLSVLIELTYAPWLIWRLLLPRTLRWLARTPRQPSPRTTGRWLVVLAVWSAAWGVAVAASQAL